MPLDTRNRRAAAVFVASPWRSVWLNPQGADNSGTRAHNAFMSRQPLPATVYTQTITLAASAGLSPTTTLTLLAALTLAAEGAVAQAAGLSFSETLSLAAAAGITPSATLTILGTVTLGGSVAVVFTDSLQVDGFPNLKIAFVGQRVSIVPTVQPRVSIVSSVGPRVTIEGGVVSA